MFQRIQERTFDILEKALPGDVPSRIFDVFIMTLIILNVIAVVLETEKSLSSQYMGFFKTFEIISVIIFTIEYILRLWSCTSENKYKNPIKGRIQFALSPLALVDLIAILPFYLPMIIPLDLRFMRVIRLLRMFRLFKIGRYSNSIKTLGNVLKEKKEELLITASVIMILLVVVSSLMYFVENEAQPEAFSSIPAAMWWGVATLTTVGYGDVYPITTIGKFLGAIISLLGIGMFALPAGILGGGFVEEMQRKRDKKKRICPHCGRNINEPPS
ncbi:ion transporter [candidate division WOR-3 bacterium]|nr:ion transporter [candidate division WOR-3 bacterium]